MFFNKDLTDGELLRAMGTASQITSQIFQEYYHQAHTKYP